MRRAWIIAATALIATPAIADVREGVDAWSRGDYRKAIEAWRPAANAGDADAQFDLGQAYTLGRGVPVDIPLAEGWFRKAALQGHIAAQAKYGLVLFDQHKFADAAPWLDKAARRGVPRAQFVLGTMLFNGDGAPKDWPRAYALMVRAAAGQTPRASEVQAQMDTLIPVEQRQQGLVLAREYEAEAQRSELPPEIAGKGSIATMRGTDLPPSNYDPSIGKPEILAMQSPPSAGRPRLGGAAGTPGARIPAIRPHAPPVAEDRDEPPPVASNGRGGWRVQLGAFGDAGNARKLWAQVGARFAGADVRYSKSGSLTRVLVGPYASKGAALAACGSVRPCVPVAD